MKLSDLTKQEQRDVRRALDALDFLTTPRGTDARDWLEEAGYLRRFDGLSELTEKGGQVHWLAVKTGLFVGQAQEIVEALYTEIERMIKEGEIEEFFVEDAITLATKHSLHLCSQIANAPEFISSIVAATIHTILLCFAVDSE